MDSFFNEIRKRLPPELPNIINIKDHSSNKISIVRVENAFSTPNAYEAYKFLLPLYSAEYPVEIIDTNKHHLKKEELIPINPGQPHFSEIDKSKPFIKIPPVLTIFVDKELMRDTSSKIFGEKNIIFENKTLNINNNLHKLINLFIEESIHQQTGYQFILENLNLQIIINILRTANSNCQDELAPKNCFEKKPTRYLMNYMKENYNQIFSLDELARTVNYSPFHLIRIFKAETGKTPFEYLLEIKINRAKQLIKNTKLSITEICFSCGFNNHSHFSTVFKRKTGYSPSQYREIIKS